MSSALLRTTKAIEASIEEGLNPGMQAFVALGGEPVLDEAFGQARAGVAMRTDQMVTWWSLTKPSTAVATAQVWERGLIGLDDPVAKYVPEFAANGKDAITIRHLLTHTAGFRTAEQVREPEWDALIAGISASRPEPGWEPGKSAGYHLTVGMTMLAEIIQRVDGRPFDQYIREEVYLPLGMVDCWIGMPPEKHAEYGSRIGTMHNTEGGKCEPRDSLDRPEIVARVSPGGGGRGPMNQLARMYEALRCHGELNGTRILRPQTVEAITARHRTGMYDKTFAGYVDWGLGFQVDAYGMGRHCSPRTFGHGGMRSGIAFCDPEFGLVLAIQANGMPDIDAHQRRFHTITSAVYEDLGILWAGAEGREKQPAKHA